MTSVVLRTFKSKATKYSGKSLDGWQFDEGVGWWNLAETRACWILKAGFQEFAVNFRYVFSSSYRIRQESALKGRLRYTDYTSWLYIEMSANGCLFKPTLQDCIEKVLGELHFGCYRKISWFKRRSQFQNPNSHTSTKLIRLRRHMRIFPPMSPWLKSRLRCAGSPHPIPKKLGVMIFIGSAWEMHLAV